MPKRIYRENKDAIRREDAIKRDGVVKRDDTVRKEDLKDLNVNEAEPTREKQDLNKTTS